MSRAPAPRAAWRDGRLVPVAAGVLAGAAVQFVALVVIAAVAVNYGDPSSDRFLLRVVLASALGLAVACGSGARVCRWSCRRRHLPDALVARAAAAAGLIAGVVVVGLDMVLLVYWKVLPFYVAAMAAGTFGERLLNRRRERSSAAARPR